MSAALDPAPWLAAPTPPAWVGAAVEQWRALLIDHANCEKKAASTALALIFAYSEDMELCTALARLAREELRHFEQVAALMRQLGVAHERQQPGRYAAGLLAAAKQHEPDRKLDRLLCAALIEARSCERLALLGPRLPAPLGEFYSHLAAAEARHIGLYLGLARAACPAQDPARWRTRLQALALLEAQLCTSPDTQLRFHSGAPVAANGDSASSA